MEIQKESPKIEQEPKETLSEQIKTPEKIQPLRKEESYGSKIRNFFSTFFLSKEVLDQKNAIQEDERDSVERNIKDMEKISTIDGVNFSRIQIAKVLSDRDSGRKIEFETLSQYICDYNMKTGEIWEDKLTNADKIGLRLGKTFRNIFPKGRLISLWDAYNTSLPESSNERGIPVADAKQIVIPETVQSNFMENSINLQKKAGGIPENGVEGVDYLYISESSKVSDAETLVSKLEKAGFIERNGEEINFINKESENPLYRKINLRTKNGRWLCEALDASSYIKPENFDITHIVVLPDSFKEQQDKVWEILRVLGIDSSNYHNIFYDDSKNPEEVAKTIEEEFGKFENKSENQ